MASNGMDESIIAKCEIGLDMVVIQKLADDEYRVARVDRGAENYEGSGTYVATLKRANEVFMVKIYLIMGGF